MIASTTTTSHVVADLLAAIRRHYRKGGSSRVIEEVRDFFSRNYPFTAAKLRNCRRKFTSTPSFHTFAVYDVNPDTIHQYIPWEMMGTFANAGRVRSGEWDRKSERLESLEKHQTIIRYLKGNITPEDLTYEYLRRHGYPEDEAKAYSAYGYAEYLDELHRSIATNGVQIDPPNPIDLPAARFDQVAIDISRDGELLFDESGCHRLTIASLLGLDRIPVRINAVHRDWYNVHGAPDSHPGLEYNTRIPIRWRDLRALDANPNTRSSGFGINGVGRFE